MRVQRGASSKSSLTMRVKLSSRCLRPKSAKCRHLLGQLSAKSRTANGNSRTSVKRDALAGKVFAQQFAVVPCPQSTTHTAEVKAVRELVYDAVRRLVTASSLTASKPEGARNTQTSRSSLEERPREISRHQFNKLSQKQNPGIPGFCFLGRGRVDSGQTL